MNTFFDHPRAARLNAADRQAILDLEAAIEDGGWTLEYQDWCECAETPGFLGQMRGVTDRTRNHIRIGLEANPTPEMIIDILQHEHRHQVDPEWDCGNRDVFGRGGPKGRTHGKEENGSR